MRTPNSHVTAWVKEMAQEAQPGKVVWCDGSEEQAQRLTKEALKTGALIELDQKKWPGCYLHLSHPLDVARTEDRTFICAPTKEDAGPTNNWMSPDDGYENGMGIFRGSMKGRTMYVIPFLMGPAGSPFSKVGIQVTDSVYVALSMGKMTRMGDVALEHLGDSGEFVKGIHSTCELDPDKRYILHFPQDNTILSVNSGYGGNALLSKKCFALRIGSWLGKQEGWLAEHMLIMGIEDPDGDITWVAGAFPSACGKTNLAMLVPPKEYKGYKIHTIGDDIAWLRFGDDGRLYAINPEAGFFGVAPGTGPKTNLVAMQTVNRNSIFTNVVMTPDKGVWWEGMGPLPAKEGNIDWKGKPWTPDTGTPGAHPNSRFTTPIKQCPTYSPLWEDPKGVPISAFLFGARRRDTMPLVYESFNWAHGVYMAATLTSETTAAATGAVGVVRRDPFAMLPFCGYNMGDYWSHWIKMGEGKANMPRIYRVNWFRRGPDNSFLWPGFGENIRVLKWIVDRCRDRAEAIDTPIGRIPPPGSISTKGLDVSDDVMTELFRIDKQAWRNVAEDEKKFFSTFGSHLPKDFNKFNENLSRAVSAA